MSGSPDDATLGDATTMPAEPATVATTPDGRSAAPIERLSPGERLGDRYIVRSLLGVGGMGAVYRVHDEVLDDDFALKVVEPAAAPRLRDEVRLAQRVTHPNVCRTFDLEELDGRRFVKMEYVRGESLAARLARGGKLPIAEVVRIARAIASGLAAAHAAGVIHRDLKPGNVMLAGDRVVLTDFGLARRAITANPADAAGTPGYMAPEQLDGGDVDARSDLFALGCVVYQLATGTLPFAGVPTGAVDLCAQRSDAPRWLVRAVGELLSIDPAARPRGAARLARGPVAARRAIAISAAGVVIGVAVAIAASRPAAAWKPDIVTIKPTFEENADSTVVSPDGKTVAFVSTRDGDWSAYTTPIDGGVVRRVARGCWWVRWTRDGGGLLLQCRRDGDWHIIEVQLPDGAETDLGFGRALPCGDAMLVATLRGGFAVALSRRWPDGRVIPVALGRDAEKISGLACDDTGERIAYTTGGQLWLIVGNEPQQLAVDGADRIAFTPGGKSIVFDRRVGGSTDLYELVLATGAQYRITEGADAVQPDVARDGSITVFDWDVTSKLLAEVSGSGSRRHGGEVRQLDQLAVSRDGRHVVARDAVAAQLVAIDLDHDTVRELGSGAAPFVSRDGTRVLFAAAAEPRQLMSVPIDGGPAMLVAELPGMIVAGDDAADGTHLEVAAAGATQAYMVDRTSATPRVAARFGEAGPIDGDRLAHNEGVAGLVIQAPTGGWRAVRVARGRDVVLEIVPPGGALGQPAYELASWPGRPAWIDDHDLAYCDARGCYRFDVARRSALDTLQLDHPFEVTAAPDGRRWFTLETVARVARRKIVNFASRPWAP